MKAPPWPVPKAQVFGLHACTGKHTASLPCLLDLPGTGFTTSGRAAITLALEGLGVRPGDRVLVPSYHCPTMVAPAGQLGATPVFYPVLASGQPDQRWLDNQAHQGVKALLAAHFFGLPQPVRQLRQWCDSRGIALVEDCAHALFGHVQGRPVGTWGHAAIGSLTKFLPVPMGGCVRLESTALVLPLTRCGTRQQLKAVLDVVEEGALHGRLGAFSRWVTGPLAGLRRLRTAPVPDPGGSATEATLNSVDAGFAIDMPLAHQRLPAVCVAMARHLPRERVVQRRRAHYQWLASALAGLPGMRPLMTDLPEGAAPYVLPLWVDQPDPGYLELRRRGVPVFRWDRPWPDVPMLPGDAGLAWSHHVIQLGCHQDLEAEDLAWIAAQVQDCLLPRFTGLPRLAQPAVDTVQAGMGSGPVAAQSLATGEPDNPGTLVNQRVPKATQK